MVLNPKSEILNQKFILTLDIGTSSTRAMLFDEQARAVPDIEAQFKYEMRTTPDGGVEADADEMLACAERAIDQVLAQAGNRHIAAVASDSLVSNILGVDADGRAVTPVFTYADTRNARQVNDLRSRLDERATHQRVGTLFHSSYLPARFLWLARIDNLKHARYWMSLGEYFLYRWTGERACSFSVASWTGLLNRAKLDWDDELIHQIPITKSQLSQLVDHDHNVGTLNREYAKRWSALRDAKFFPTIGDGAAANIGSGCVDTSSIALTIGTSSAMRVAYPRGTSSIPWGLWSYSINRDLELLGGALNEGGNFFGWLKRTLQIAGIQNPEAEAGKLEPDSTGLTVLPFLTGERAPNWNADARAAIIGLSLTTRPIEIWRAGLEAIAYRLASIFELLRAISPNANQVIGSGGAMVHSPAWQQIIADTLNVPVVVSAEAEATSRGTALLALKALGVIKSLNDLPAQTGATFTPDAARHQIYARAMERQKWLYNQILTKE